VITEIKTETMVTPGTVITEVETTATEIQISKRDLNNLSYVVNKKVLLFCRTFLFLSILSTR